jgi:uncharacterized protein YbjT (DUF2867 family)
MIMVTGATGNLGRPLIARLAAEGAKVRALTRDPGRAALPEGVEAWPTARPDFAGVDAVLLNIAGVAETLDAFLDAARAAGVPRIVTLSTLLVAEEPDAAPGSTAALHRGLERAVEAAVPQWTHLRAGAFASNALQWRPQLRSGDVVRGPYAEARTAPLDESDLAAVAVRALLEDGLLGRAPVLTGPEDLTTARQVEILGRVLGRSLRYEELDPRSARRAILAMAPWAQEAAVDSMLGYLARTVGRPARVTTETADILGRPARTFAQWAAARAEAFAD